MKIIAMLLAMSGLTHLGALHSVLASYFLHSLENLLIAACDSPDPSYEDHYE